MGRPKRFDPIDWFASACFAVLAGTLALVAAVHLLLAVWQWVAIGLAVIVTLVALCTAMLWWHRRQSW